MRKVIGGASSSCEKCKGTMLFIDTKEMGVISQCRTCGNMVKGKSKQIISYNFNERGEIISGDMEGY